MINRRALLATGLILPLAACSSRAARLAPLTDGGTLVYRLAPGDEVRIAVFGFDQIANVYTVSDSGTISLPLLSTIDVANRTSVEVEQRIAALLRERELAPNASVSVQIQKYRPFYILGEVQRPGQYPYVPGMTLTTAVAIAGGYTFRAANGLAAVTRTVDGRQAHGRAGPTTPILPGDTVEVPEAWF